MAAVLCNFFSDVCKGTCDAIGKVCCLPCRACGLCTRELSDMCSSPFCIYLSVALGLNLPPVVFAIRASLSNGAGWNGCRDAMIWLYVNAALCAVNMAAAIYITERIQKQRDETVTVNQLENGTYYEATAVSTGPGGDTSRHNSLQRIRKILCYDPWVAVYIVIGVFYLIWQSVGWSRWLGAGVTCEDGTIGANVFHSLICDAMFISLGATAFACSLCCLR